MSSRMEKYENSSLNNMSRTKRNQDIYNVTDMNELSRIKTNTMLVLFLMPQKKLILKK